MTIFKKENRPPISKTKRIAFCAMFTALALALSIVENYFPIALLIPVPGVKLGLANIVTVFAIVMLSPWDTLLIILLRCLVMGLFTGPVSLFFSLSGALLAFLVMKGLSFGLGKVFSVVGISMAGAVVHNIGQILAAVFIMRDTGLIFSYLPLLLIVALFTGMLTGVAAVPVITIIRKGLIGPSLSEG
jgi:heptaprenyl diphosphate synthase